MKRILLIIIAGVFYPPPLLAEPVNLADRVVIDKSKRTMRLFSGDVELVSFDVSLGRAPIGAKECEGDNKTPEGVFRIIEHKRDSAYHRALRLSYPEPVQQKIASAKGCQPGDAIMIHGIRNGFGWLGRLHRLVDWTRGCIAVTNEEIENVWIMVPDGTVVEIKP